MAVQLTIADTLDWAAQQYPEHPALVFEVDGQRHRWSYRQLQARTRRLAQALVGLGLGKGDVIACFLYNRSEFVLSLLACAQIGAIFNPINYRLAAQELHFILNDGQAKALLFEAHGSDVARRALESGTPVQHALYVDAQPHTGELDFHALLEAAPAKAVTISVDENDPCILMYTSGTTGRPKGVVHLHRSKLQHNALMHQVMGLTQRDIGLACAPLNHTAELHTSFLPRLQLGATQVLAHHFDATDILRLIEQERVTHFFAAPTMITLLLNAPNLEQYDLSSLRLVEYGGASMAPALIREFKARVGADLVQVYGTTEMGPCMSVLPPHEQLSHAGSAGKAALNHQIVVARLRDDGEPSNPAEPCAVDEVGEILLRGPSMMQGYLNRPDANARALAYGWYHTGDLGCLDADGYLWIRDRMNHMIISGAENIYPREVEDALMEHPQVQEAAVIGQADEKWGQLVVAYVIPRPGAELDAAALDQFLIDGERLAHYKRPRRYVLVDTLPKTASGKIQKFVLERQAS